MTVIQEGQHEHDNRRGDKANPHRGDCVGTRCPVCDCCMHCPTNPDYTCPACPGCDDPEGLCACSQPPPTEEP